MIYSLYNINLYMDYKPMIEFYKKLIKSNGDSRKKQNTNQ